MPTLQKPEVVEFDEESHTYRINKKKVPGVNEILRKVGLLKDYSGISPFYADRGKATHLAIRYFLEGTLDTNSIDPVVKPHFEAFLKFFESRYQGKLLAVEKPFIDMAVSFAGTPDLITDKAIYDWKCSKDHDKAADLQGMGYKLLALNNGFGKLPFIVVELHDDGSFREFNYGDGVEEWASVMDLYRWRTNVKNKVKN